MSAAALSRVAWSRETPRLPWGRGWGGAAPRGCRAGRAAVAAAVRTTGGSKGRKQATAAAAGWWWRDGGGSRRCGYGCRRGGDGGGCGGHRDGHPDRHLERQWRRQRRGAPRRRRSRRGSVAEAARFPSWCRGTGRSGYTRAHNVAALSGGSGGAAAAFGSSYLPHPPPRGRHRLLMWRGRQRGGSASRHRPRTNPSQWNTDTLSHLSCTPPFPALSFSRYLY